MPDKPVVHVIDDDEALRESLSFLLGTAHFEVRVYDSAVGFLEGLGQAAPGCIITDVRMPGMSGLDLLRQLATLGATFAVIVITGHGDVPLAVEAMKLGAVDFLEKPFDDNALITAVRTALNRRERDLEHDSEKLEIHGRIAVLSNRERRCLRASWLARRTRRSRLPWASARARSRSTAPI